MRYDENYDPNAPEGESRAGTAYVTRKDVKIVGVALVLLAICSYPVFRVLQRRSQKSICIQNMKSIMDSINQYAIQNEEKFPPIFDSGPADEPALQASGAPYTWASDLREYMNPRASFVCPSADPTELSRSQDPRTVKGSFPLSYGMFAPLSGFSRSLVDDPDEAVLIAETSNRGALNTYDPIPFKDSGGNPMPYDGMVVGWDTDNFDGSDMSKFVTRLAFPNSNGPKFMKDGEGRHDEGTFILTVTGHLRTVNPTITRVQRRNLMIYGPWPMPLTNKRHP